MSEAVPFLSESAQCAEDSIPNKEEALLQSPKKYKPLRTGLLSMLTAAFMVSLTVNAIQASYWARGLEAQNCKLPLTGLDFSTEVTFGMKSEYGESSDMAAADKLWYSINADEGFITLPKELNLGATDPFPWDTSKRIYVLNGYHQLHCLKGIYNYVRDTQKGDASKTQTIDHILHCLDVMRSDAICTADDTPLSVEFYEPDMTEPPKKRQCRDWSQLSKFAIENSACLKRRAPGDPLYDTLEEWTHCPEGSPYLKAVEEWKTQNKTSDDLS